MFFPFCYAFSLAFSDVHDGVISNAVASGDAINTSVRLGGFSHDSALGFGARPWWAYNVFTYSINCFFCSGVRFVPKL